ACGSVDSNTATVTVNAPPTGVRQKTPVDFNGDRVSEFVLFRNGIWITYNPSTGAEVSRVNTGAMPGGIPEPMEWNGDGRTGYAGAIPVPGYYDGNGTEEAVIYRNGSWIFYDPNSFALVKTVWAAANSYNGDPVQPPPLDYDGDGSVDLAVYGATPWHTYFDNGGYRGGIFTGGIPGDLALSRRDHPDPTPP